MYVKVLHLLLRDTDFFKHNSLKMKPLLSIIIPFYNCGPVIERCINSIDYSNAEIIIVNDGSRVSDVKLLNQAIDNSNKNIRLINKENGGVSSARNIGLQNATGKYIVFIDADDYLDKKQKGEVL